MIKVFHVSHWLSHFFCCRCRSYPLLLHFLFGGFMSRLYATFSPRRKLCNVENLFPTLLFNALFFSLLLRQTFFLSLCRAMIEQWGFLMRVFVWWRRWDGSRKSHSRVRHGRMKKKWSRKRDVEKFFFLFALIWWMVWLIICFFSGESIISGMSQRWIID